jgi:hypothetical protein
LRATLAALEGGQRGLGDSVVEGDALEGNRSAGWTFGAPEIDGLLPERPLDTASLY